MLAAVDDHTRTMEQDVSIRPARRDEHAMLESLQRRASLNNPGDREALLALAMRIVGMGMAIAETPDELAQTDSQFRKIYGLPADKSEIGVGEWLKLLHPPSRCSNVLTPAW